VRGLREIKALMVAGLALYPLLVAFGNLTDYGSNFAFVRHVLSMDTTFPGNKLMYRAITAPVLQHVAYGLIILGEAAAGVALAYGALALWRARKASAKEYALAKRPAVTGCFIGFLVWFVGFLVIAGEWFAMWQSPTWNGQEAAFRFVVPILLVMLFVLQPEERVRE
jgi:predicted small integral membrane protein